MSDRLPTGPWGPWVYVEATKQVRADKRHTHLAIRDFGHLLCVGMIVCIGNEAAQVVKASRRELVVTRCYSGDHGGDHADSVAAGGRIYVPPLPKPTGKNGGKAKKEAA